MSRIDNTRLASTLIAPQKQKGREERKERRKLNGNSIVRMDRREAS
jgi:hypothetical protein